MKCHKIDPFSCCFRSNEFSFFFPATTMKNNNKRCNVISTSKRDCREHLQNTSYTSQKTLVANLLYLLHWRLQSPSRHQHFFRFILFYDKIFFISPTVLLSIFNRKPPTRGKRKVYWSDDHHHKLQHPLMCRYRNKKCSYKKHMQKFHAF